MDVAARVFAWRHLPDADVLVPPDSRVEPLVELAPPIGKRLAVRDDIAGMSHGQRDQHELALGRALRHPLESLAQPRAELLRPSLLASVAHEVLPAPIPPDVAPPRAPALHDPAVARAARELRRVGPLKRRNTLERVGSLQRRFRVVGRPRAPTREHGRHALAIASLGHLLRLWAR